MPTPTETEPIDRRSARQAVYERISSWIESGQLEPGETIKDSQLAAKLGVSRTPVREALQMLEQIGLVEMRPGRLTRVSDSSFDDAERVYAPLAELQALAAELGTPKATPADVDEMCTSNNEMLAAIENNDPVAAREADREFHGVLVRLADNPYLTAAIEPMLAHIRRLEALYFHDTKPGRTSYEEHQRIIEFVAAHDARHARELTRHNFLRHWTPSDRGVTSGAKT
jgi:DNA-binding GntR family transcriptional regulator